jgi:hypothetical protein
MNEREKKPSHSKQTRNSFYSALLSAFYPFYSILLNGPRCTPFSHQLATVELPPYDPYDPDDKESCSQIALVAASGGWRGYRRGNTLPIGGEPALRCGTAVLGDRCTSGFRETIRGAGPRRARREIQIGAYAFQFGGA